MAASTPVFFKWKDAFRLGLPGIDAEHQQFFEIMNRCAMAAKQGASPTTVQTLLQELATYADHHFAHEEAELDRVGYPELEAQRAEHLRFRHELERIRALEAPSVLAALALARDWLLQHVTGTDRHYVAWITKDRPRRAI
jgi:hemerythrin-like metal-binding protein